MDAVQKLEEKGGEAASLAAGGQIAALAEFVAEGQPLFLHEHLKAFQRPVKRITEKLGERNHLEKEERKIPMKYMPCGKCRHLMHGTQKNYSANIQGEV